MPSALSPGLGLRLPVPVPVAPAVHLVAGAAWTRHLRYLILPLRLQPSPCPPAPLSAYELCRPDITQARQSWAEQPPPTHTHTPPSALGDATGAPAALSHLVAAPRLPLRPDVAPPPAPLVPRWVLSAGAFIPSPHPSIRRDRMWARPRAVKLPSFWPPWVPGHAPAPPFPHLETVAMRVSDTDTRAQASGFRGGKAARVTA